MNGKYEFVNGYDVINRRLILKPMKQPLLLTKF